MTKAELVKSHDAMAQFIRGLCKRSDVVWGGNREPITDRHYRRALRLLKQAGFPYKSVALTGEN